MLKTLRMQKTLKTLRTLTTLREKALGQALAALDQKEAEKCLFFNFFERAKRRFFFSKSFYDLDTGAKAAT